MASKKEPEKKQLDPMELEEFCWVRSSTTVIPQQDMLGQMIPAVVDARVHCRKDCALFSGTECLVKTACKAIINKPQ